MGKIEKDEEERKILKYLKRGFSCLEIVKQGEISISYQTVRKKKKIYIDSGEITEEDIQKARYKREREKLKKDPYIKILLKYSLKGLCCNQIAQKPDMPWQVTKIYRELDKCMTYGLITEEQIKQARGEPKEPEEEAKESEYNLIAEEVKEEPKESEYKLITEKQLEEQLKEARKERRELAYEEQIGEGASKRLSQLKREVSAVVKFNKKPSEEEKAKIREYIDLTYGKYQKEQISKEEILFLKRAINVVPIKDDDIIEFAILCKSTGNYTQALEVIRNRQQMQKIPETRKKEELLKKMERFFYKCCKVQKAIRTYRKRKQYN